MQAMLVTGQANRHSLWRKKLLGCSKTNGTLARDAPESLNEVLIITLSRHPGATR